MLEKINRFHLTRLINNTGTINVKMDGSVLYVNSFIPCTTRFWNSLPMECFPLTYDLNDFKSSSNRDLLGAGSV